MIDTHCHISLPQYDHDRKEVLTSAQRAGVVAVINPGTNKKQSRAAVALASSYPFVWAAVGVHPHEAKCVTEEIMQQLVEIGSHPRVVAVGEIGLEDSGNAPPMNTQTEALSLLMKVGKELALPYIFHVRDAHKQFRAFLDSYGHPIRGVMHCFSGTIDDADVYVSHGLSIGITGAVTFPNADNVRDVVRHVPLESLVTETDGPFLAPQQHRGKRNEPAYVSFVIDEIARVRRIPVEEVSRATMENAKRLFAI